MAERPSETNEIYRTMDLALRIGELLLSSGAGAADVAAQMDNVAQACGLRGTSTDVTFTELAMSHQARVDEPALIQLRQVRYRQVDFGHLTEVDRLVRDLAAERVTRDEASIRLKKIVSSGHSRPRWSVTLGQGLVGAGVGMVLGGDWVVIGIALVGAVGVDLIQRRMSSRRWPVFYQQVAGGLFATLLAAGVAKTGLDVAPSRVITASIVLLLAGVSFLGAVQDALTGFPLTSGARILEAVIATAGAIAGVSGGLTLARVLNIGLGTLDPGAVRFAELPMLTLGGALTAAAYAFASYVPYRAILPIAFIGALAMTVYYLAAHHRVGTNWASGVAAVVIGLVSWVISGRARVPALVVVTTAIVPLLPGLSIYRGLALFGAGNSNGLLALANAAAILIALSSGVLLGQYIAQPLKREARRLESRLSGPRLVGPLSVRTGRRRRRKRPS
ncbi:threonine/serine exporter ThrE family protein [uncultured Jatrophihabitans sp.]|uniref:threonine/serine ThrE exporter family protein n=1 Tax=uncultured Jatrophihabitans sp. TaxID=1610747 RepID=UPI0035CC70E1